MSARLKVGCQVEGCILGRHDGRRNEERDARVVHAREPLQQRLIGDTAHGVPHTAADQAFARGKEEDGCKEDVRLGGKGEVG